MNIEKQASRFHRAGVWPSVFPPSTLRPRPCLLVASQGLGSVLRPLRQRLSIARSPRRIYAPNQGRIGCRKSSSSERAKSCSSRIHREYSADGGAHSTSSNAMHITRITFAVSGTDRRVTLDASRRGRCLQSIIPRLRNVIKPNTPPLYTVMRFPYGRCLLGFGWNRDDGRRARIGKSPTVPQPNTSAEY